MYYSVKNKYYLKVMMDYNYSKTVEKLPDNIRLVIFFAGLGGQIVTRILSTHPECYWTEKWNNTSEPDLKPTQFPDTISGFDLISPDVNTMKDEYGRAPGGLGFMPPVRYMTTQTEKTRVVKESIKHILNSIKTVDSSLYVWIHTHPYLYDSDQESPNFSDLKRPFVYLWASEECVFTQLRDKDFHIKNNSKLRPPCSNPLAYNLDVSQLFSKDYAKFEAEYIKLCTHFNFTSRLDSVRAFILRYLERQEYIAQF